MKNGFVLVAGTFIGNWLSYTWLRGKSFQEGFEIGIIAALIVLIIYAAYCFLRRKCFG